MKLRHIYIIIIMFCASTNVAHSQDLYIKESNPDANYTTRDYLTGSPFTLSLLPSTLSGCDDLIVRFDTEGKYKVDFVSFENNNFVHHRNGTEHEIIFSTAGLSAYNVFLGCFLDNEILCNTDPLTIQFELELCGTIQQTNVVTINPLYNDHHDISVAQYETSRACIGGYSKFDLDINTANQLGSYRLTNTVATITVNGILTRVFDHGNNELPFTVISSSACQMTVEYNIGTIRPLGGTMYHKYIVENSCDCSAMYNSSSVALSVVISGNNPCGVMKQLTSSTTNQVSSDCCGTGYSGNVEFAKNLHLGDDKPFCASECIRHAYSLYTDFKDVPQDIQNFKIIDELPPEVIITEMRFPQQFLQFDFDFCYQLSSNPGVDICKRMGVDLNKNFTIGSESPAASDHEWIPQGTQVIKFSWVSNDLIPAWFHKSAYFHNYFYIKDNVAAVSDNVATFESNIFSEIISLTHPDIEPCEGSDLSMQCYPSATHVTPGQSLTLDLYVFNYGDSELPLGDLQIDLTNSAQYVGPYNFNEDVGTQYVFQNSGNVISWSGLEIQPKCFGYDWVRLSVPIQINYGVSSGPLTITTNINGYPCSMHLFITELFAVEDRIYYRCANGELTEENQLISATSDLELVYELKNIGNLPIENIKLMAMKPSTGDISLASGNPRNSQFDLEFESGVIELNNNSFTTSYTSNVNASSICQTTGVANSNQAEIIIIEQSVNGQLTAGETFSIAVPFSIPNPAQNGQQLFADFEYCIDVPSINVYDKEYSSLHNIHLEVEEAFECSAKICETNSSFMDRIDDAFTITDTGSGITISTQGLSDYDYWTVASEAGHLGAQNVYWGDQTVQLSYNVLEQNDLCISIENYLLEADANSEQCNCTFFCETITLE